MCRAAGTSAKLFSKDGGYALLKLSSGEIRKARRDDAQMRRVRAARAGLGANPEGSRQVLDRCYATIGRVSNENWKHRVLGKAGASAWVGRRSKASPALRPLEIALPQRPRASLRCRCAA